MVALALLTIMGSAVHFRSRVMYCSRINSVVSATVNSAIHFVISHLRFKFVSLIASHPFVLSGPNSVVSMIMSLLQNGYGLMIPSVSFPSATYNS